MPSPRHAALTLVWLLPASRTKNALLRALGHLVSADARVGMNLVLRVDRVDVGSGGRIGRGNVLKDLRSVTLGAGASIDNFNLVSAHPVYKRLYADGAVLELAPSAKIISRHSIDCSGRVTLGSYASLAGHQTVILTHSVDLGRDAQAAYPVAIGERSFVGTHCLILGGASLPARSVLAAGSLLTRSPQPRQAGLWAGSPAALRGPVDGAWFDRSRKDTLRLYDPSQDITFEDVV